MRGGTPGYFLTSTLSLSLAPTLSPSLTLTLTLSVNLSLTRPPHHSPLTFHPSPSPGKPGYFPTFDQLPHPVPFNLYDPFKISKNKTPEQKAKGLITEINNGRLAMIGLFGFLAETQLQGSVPGLTGLGLKAYSGNIMAPFDSNFHIFGQ